MRSAWLCVSLLCVLLSDLAEALPLYASIANTTFPLVVCRGLDAAVAELRQRELDEHAIGAAWLERDCVSIDPCAQTSSNEDPYFGTRLPALAGVWLSGNSSALRLPLGAARLADAEGGGRAENHGSLEFARVPEGLRVQACAPDFDRWRREGVLACNEETLVTITADAAARACPGTPGFTLLDCVRPLQFDAGAQTLMRRPPEEKMHFGALTRAEACWWTRHALAAQMCVDADEYSMQVPVAAPLGSTSLVKYEFLEGYGCLRESDLAGVGQDKVLSRAAAPNRVLACPPVAHGSHARADPYTCGVQCDAGFRLEGGPGGACVSECAGLVAACSAGTYAAESCAEGPRTLYRCAACEARAGFGAAAWDAARADECQFEGCVAGTRSEGLACVACGVNTFSSASGASSCEDCETLRTGLYQRATGRTACEACLWRPAAETELCAPGTELVAADSRPTGPAGAWQRVEALFAAYAQHGHAVNVSDFYVGFCTAGFACMPCAPGHAAEAEAGLAIPVCEPCAFGSYQENIGATACHACAAGQNTLAEASTKASDCVCTAGHE
jgi:hypothetical protein